MNITDEEKEKLKITCSESASNTQSETSNRPFLDTVLSALDCSENDYLALLGLCLIYGLANNKGSFKSLNNILHLCFQSILRLELILTKRLIVMFALSILSLLVYAFVSHLLALFRSKLVKLYL